LFKAGVIGDESRSWLTAIGVPDVQDLQFSDVTSFPAILDEPAAPTDALPRPAASGTINATSGQSKGHGSPWRALDAGHLGDMPACDRQVFAGVSRLYYPAPCAG